MSAAEKLAAKLEAVGPLVEEIAEALSVTSNGAKMGPSLVGLIATDLALAEVDVSEVNPTMDFTMLLEAAEAAYKREYAGMLDLPGSSKVLIKRWAGARAASAAPMAVGGGGGGKPIRLDDLASVCSDSALSVKKPSKEMLVQQYEEELSTLAPNLRGASKIKALNACVDQGLSPGAVASLCLTMHACRVVTESEAQDNEYVFGTDPSQCKLIRNAKKSGVKTLAMVLSDHDYLEINEWFNTVCRLLAEDERQIESARVSQFISRLGAILSGNGPKVAQYIEKYMCRHHVGLGLPILIGHDILATVNSSSSGPSKEEFSEVNKLVKSLKETVAKTSTELNTLKQQVTTLKTKVEKANFKPGGQGKPDPKKPSKKPEAEVEEE